MQGWIGTQTYGTVERLGDESVQTDFFCVIVPVWPLRSYYVSKTDDGPVITPIALHRTSVAAGFLRVIASVAAVIVGVPGLLDPQGRPLLLAIGVALAAIASWSTFGVGRLSPHERARRELLRRVIGVGAPPELLPADTVKSIRAQLEAAWRRHGRGSWADAIVAHVGDELLVALAEYHQRAALAEQARANLRPDADLTDDDYN